MDIFACSDLIAARPNEIECYELMLKPKDIIDASNDANLVTVGDIAVDDNSDDSDEDESSDDRSGSSDGSDSSDNSGSSDSSDSSSNDDAVDNDDSNANQIKVPHGR